MQDGRIILSDVVAWNEEMQKQIIKILTQRVAVEIGRYASRDISFKTTM